MGIITGDATLTRSPALASAGCRVAAVANQIAVVACYAFLVAVPLTYTGNTNDMFDLPKLVVLRVLTLVALLALLAGGLARGRLTLRRTALDLPLLVYLLLAAAATANSISPILSLNGEYQRYDGLYTTVNYVILFLLAAHVLRRGRVLTALKVATLAGVVVGLEGVSERLGFDILLPGSRFFEGRPSSFLGNPDFLGAYLALILPLAIGLLLASNTRSARLGWSLAVAALAVALAVTFTRGAWLAFFASLPVFLIVWRQLVARIAWLAGTAGAALLALALVLGPDALGLPFGPGPIAGSAAAVASERSLVDRVTSARDLRGGTVAVRLQIWQSALPLVAENPLLGTGPNTFRSVLMRHVTVDYAAGEGRTREPDRAHNYYLQLAVTNGLLGLAAYLAVLAAFIVTMARWLRRETRPRARVLGVAVLAAVVAYLVQDLSLFGVLTTSSVWWILLGLGVALCCQEGPPRLALALRWPAPARWLLLAVAALLAGYLALGAVRLWQADEHFMRARFGAVHVSAAVDPQASVRQFRQAIALQPNETFYLDRFAARLAEMSQAEGLGAKPKVAYLDEAVALATRTIDLNPRSASLHFRRGAYYELYGDDHQLDALRDYRRAVALYPNSYDFNTKLAQFARRFGAVADAIAAQRAALAVVPDDRAGSLDLSRDYGVAQRYDEAQAVLEALLQRDAADLEARLILALVFERKKDSERALAEYRTVLAGDPANEAAAAGIARIENVAAPLPHPVIDGAGGGGH